MTDERSSAKSEDEKIERDTQAKLEKALHEIIKSGIPKAVNIDDGNEIPFALRGKRIYISKKIIKKLKEHEQQSESSGGLLPLAALIPLIAGLIGGAGAAAGGVAGVVQSVKSAQKDDAQKKLAEEQLTQLKEKSKKENSESGEGLFLNQKGQPSITVTSEQGSGISDFLRNILKNSNIEKPEKTELKNLFKNLKHGIKIEKSGSGLFLNPNFK